MARSTAYWKQFIMDAIAADTALSALNNTSVTAIYGLFARAVAYCIRAVDVLFDSHRADIENTLLLEKHHRPSWYRQKALDFQYGYPLVAESDFYDNTGITDETIATSKVVKYAAVNEAVDESRLIIKIAGENSGVLAPITTPQLNAITNYFARVKDAGVIVTIKNYPADRLYLYMRIFYDPLIIAADGTNIQTSGRPVEDALNAFMKELPFNGELILPKLVDRLQAVEGVIIPQLDNAYTCYLDPLISDYGTAVAIDVKKTPESGYFSIVDFTNILYQPYV